MNTATAIDPELAPKNLNEAREVLSSRSWVIAGISEPTGIAIIVFGTYSIIQSKKENSGFISFSEAFKSYFITISLGYLIGSIVTILVFVIIDPEAAKVLDDEMLIMSKEMLEGFGLSKEMIAISLEEASKKSNFSLSSISLQYVMNIAFFSLIGLLISLITKKENK